MRVGLGPNDRQPCGTDASRRRHLAKGEQCDTCGTDRLADAAVERPEVSQR